MKINGSFNSIVAGATKSPSKDGSSFYYNLSVIDSDTSEAGMVSCTNDVYNIVASKDFQRFSVCNLGFIYDSNYKWLRVVSVG